MGYEGVLGFDCTSNGPTNGRIIQCSGFQFPTPSYVYLRTLIFTEV